MLSRRYWCGSSVSYCWCCCSPCCCCCCCLVAVKCHYWRCTDYHKITKNMILITVSEQIKFAGKFAIYNLPFCVWDNKNAQCCFPNLQTFHVCYVTANLYLQIWKESVADLVQYLQTNLEMQGQQICLQICLQIWFAWTPYLNLWLRDSKISVTHKGCHTKMWGKLLCSCRNHQNILKCFLNTILSSVSFLNFIGKYYSRISQLKIYLRSAGAPGIP
jgi:hypothetical protein